MSKQKQSKFSSLPILTGCQMYCVCPLLLCGRIWLKALAEGPMALALASKVQALALALALRFWPWLHHWSVLSIICIYLYLLCAQTFTGLPATVSARTCLVCPAYIDMFTAVVLIDYIWANKMMMMMMISMCVVQLRPKSTSESSLFYWSRPITGTFVGGYV